MVVRLLIPVLVVAMTLAACSSTSDSTGTERTLAYGKIFVDSNQVGWIEKRQNVDPDGIRTVIDLVKDLDFEVRGYIREGGKAVKVQTMTPAHRDALGEEKKYIDLPAGSRGLLVAMILDLPTDSKVTFVKATSADIRGE
jgi:hypothetical protein